MDEQVLAEKLCRIKANISYKIVDRAGAERFIKRLRCLPGFYFKKAIYFIGDGQKSEQKFMGAVKSYAAALQADEFPLICFDNTAFGGAEDGCLITTKGIYIHNLMEDSHFLQFKNIRHKVETRGMFKKDIYINGFKLDTNLMESEDVDQFAVLFDLIVYKFITPELNIVQTEPMDEQEKKEACYDREELRSYLNDLRQMYRQFNFSRNVYYWGDTEKSNKKIQGAVRSYAKLVTDELPLICFDNTVFGGAEDGCLLTTRGIYVHNQQEIMNFFAYDMLLVAEVRGVFSKDIYVNTYKIDTTCMNNDECEGFVELINLLAKKFGGEIDGNNGEHDTDREHEKNASEEDGARTRQETRQQYQSGQDERKQSNPENMTLAECYIVLGCSVEDDVQVIGHKYKTLVKQYHPDLFATAPKEFVELANAKLKIFNMAYNRICQSKKA